jgi:hypothetical protein
MHNPAFAVMALNGMRVNILRSGVNQFTAILWSLSGDFLSFIQALVLKLQTPSVLFRR